MKEIQDLKELEYDYRSSEGTAGQRESQSGFAVHNFDNLLRIARNLSYEVERLDEMLENKPNHNTVTHVEIGQFEFYHDEYEEIDEAKEAMYHARYGM